MKVIVYRLFINLKKKYDSKTSKKFLENIIHESREQESVHSYWCATQTLIPMQETSNMFDSCLISSPTA